MLNTIHHHGLRLALVAFRTSPVESLYVEAGEPPLEQRRIKLSLQYITKLKATPSNPAYDCVFHPKNHQKYTRNTKTIAPLGIRMKHHLESSYTMLDEIYQNDDYNILPSELCSQTIDITLHLRQKMKLKIKITNKSYLNCIIIWNSKFFFYIYGRIQVWQLCFSVCFF